MKAAQCKGDKYRVFWGVVRKNFSRKLGKKKKNTIVRLFSDQLVEGSQEGRKYMYSGIGAIQEGIAKRIYYYRKQGENEQSKK